MSHAPVRSRLKSTVRWFLGAALAPVVLLCGALAAYDPLHVFHAPWHLPADHLNSNLRLELPGIVRRADFDSVVLGTSVFENLSAPAVGAALGGHFVNLSLTAADFVERRVALEFLLRQRAVAQVLYSLDNVYLEQRTGYPRYPMSTWAFLYDRNRIDDIRVYLNRHFIECLMHWSVAPDCAGRAATLERPNAWLDDPEQSRRFGGIERWCAARDNYQVLDSRDKLREARDRMAAGIAPDHAQIDAAVSRALAYVDAHLLAVVRAHPQTRFRLVFPPYARARFAIWHQSRPDWSAIHVAMIRHLAAAVDSLPNLELTGFEDDTFPDDIAHYKDFVHFAPDIDARIVADLAAGRHRLNGANVEAYVATSLERARAYDLQGLLAHLEQCIDAR